MNTTSLFVIFFSAIFVNNFVLSRFLGICPFIGVSKSIDSSLGMGAAVCFVMAFATAVTWPVQHYILIPFKIEYLQTIAFILTIASLVQFIEMFIMKKSKNLYNSLGVFLPLITTNCAVLGVTILNIQEKYSFIQSIVNALGSAIGFTIALVLLAGIRERLDNAPVPSCFRGTPIAFVSAGLLAIAFMGFSGIL